MSGDEEGAGLGTRQRLLGLYILAVAFAGFASVVYTLLASRNERLIGDHPLLLLTFALLLVAAEARPMLHLVKSSEITGSWTFAFAMLFVAPPPLCLIAMALATLSVDLRQRKPLSRALFNAGQMTVGLTAGVLAGSLISDLVVRSTDSVDLRWLIGALVAFTVAHAVNVLCMAVVVALHQGLPIRELVRRSIDTDLAMDGLLLSLAPVLVIVGITAPLLIPLVLISALTIYRSASIALSNEHEATHDLLTDIPNRRLFEDHAAMMLRGVEATERRAAVLQIDLDGFKAVNDRLGHRYGDEVLRVVALRLAAIRRPTDQISRLGGDEFAIASGDLTYPSEAIQLAEEVYEAIQRPMEVEGIPLAISASIGVSLFPDHGEGLQELLHHADTAMYKAKSRGGGVQMFESVAAEVGPRRAKLLADLGGAIGTEQLYMHFQPRVSIETGKIPSVEALLRWDHPEHGTVAPSWFMPQTEQTELVTALTDEVMDMSLSAVSAWHEEGLPVGVAVNVSARNLHDLRFPQRVSAALERTGVDAKWLELEITENTVMADPTRSAVVLGELREIGVRISVDDFGTGYSSLASLRNLEIDCIKIDRSFVTDLDKRGGDLVIVRSIIDLAQNLGLETVAEGVETEEVLEIVKDLGCDFFQGFLVARPAAADELLPALRASQGRPDVAIAKAA